jgi:hypothetical protein
MSILMDDTNLVSQKNWYKSAEAGATRYPRLRLSENHANLDKDLPSVPVYYSFSTF